MSKHTEGPWHASGTGNHQGLVISEATGANVAVTYDGEADTDLIAAAPDLLAALKEVESAMFLEAYANPRDDEDVDPLYQMVRDAIAKAEGGQE